MEAINRPDNSSHHSHISIASPSTPDLDDKLSLPSNHSLIADLGRAAVSSSDSAAVAAAAAALDSNRNDHVLSSNTHVPHTMSLFAFSGPLMTSGIEARAGDSERAASPNQAAAALSALLAGDRPLDSSKHSSHLSVAPTSESLRSVAQSLQSLQHMGSPTSINNRIHSTGLEALTTHSSTDPQLLGDSSLGAHTPQQKYGNVGDLRTPTSDSMMDGDHSMFDTGDSHMDPSLDPRSQDSPKSPSNKRHKCQFCSTVFTRHHNLKSHLLTHSQEKPFRCDECNVCFRRLHDLKRHSKLHSGEKPHKCSRCGRPFARGDALARHTKGPGGCAGRRSSFGADDSHLGRGGDRPGINGIGTSPSPMGDMAMGSSDAAAVEKMSHSLSGDHNMTGLSDDFSRDGPYSAAGANVGIYSSQVSSQGHSHIEAQVHAHMDSQGHSQMDSQGHSQMDSQGHSQMNSQVQSQMDSQLRSQMDSHVHSQIDSHIHSQIESQVHAQMESQVHSQMEAQVHSQIESQVHSQIESQVHAQMESATGSSHDRGNIAVANMSFSTSNLPYSTTLAGSPTVMSPSHTPMDHNQHSRPSPYDRIIAHNEFSAAQSAASLHSIPTDPRLGISSGSATPTSFHHVRSPMTSHASLVNNMAAVSSATTPTISSAHIANGLSEAELSHGQHNSHMDSPTQGQIMSHSSNDLGSPLLSVIKDLHAQMTQIKDTYEKKVSDLQDEVSLLQGQLLLRQSQEGGKQ